MDEHQVIIVVGEPRVPMAKVLGWIGRIRILDLLAKEGERTLNGIKEEVHLSWNAVKRHLIILMDLGLVRLKVIGRRKLYQFIFNAPRGQAFKTLRDAWERRGLGQTKHLLETVLGRSGRIQILDYLMKKSRSQEPMEGLASITEISDHVGLNHTATQDHLEVLGEAGLVQEKKFGRRLRIYRFARESSLALPLQDFFSTWNRRSG